MSPLIGNSRLAVFMCLISIGAVAAPAQPAPGTTDNSTLKRGEQIARAVTTVTGTAISPLLGVCVLGAFNYVKTPESARAKLPFYCHPGFWIPVAILIILVMLKDTVGAAVPLLKKPLDAVEILIVNKAAFLFAVLPVVWHEASSISALMPGMGFLATVHAAVPGAARGGGGGAPMAFTFITGAIAAFAIWLTTHAVDVLALLSPIPLLDAMFKAIRAVIFLFLGGLALIDSKAALVISVVITAICLLCVAWALRVAVFGAVFAWDTLRSIFLGYRSNPITDREVLAFTANPLGGLRKRCFGALRIAPDGSLEFVRMPLGFGFRKTVRLRSDRYEVGRGFLFPCVLAPDFGGREYQFQFRLLPRYLGYEEEVRDTLRLSRVRDLRVPSEFKAAWKWLHDTIQGDRAA